MSDTLSEIFSMAYEEFKTTVTNNGVEVTGRIPLPRDLVLVIRCKDCTYFQNDGDGYYSCSDLGFGVSPYDFCSSAERKMDEVTDGSSDN